MFVYTVFLEIGCIFFFGYSLKIDEICFVLSQNVKNNQNFYESSTDLAVLNVLKFCSFLGLCQ